MKKVLNVTVERVKKGWSMKDVSEKIGVSRPMISYYESGKNLPSQARRKQFEALFGTNAVYLFSEVGK